MHPDTAYRLVGQRHAELVTAVAQQRLVDEAKHAHAAHAGLSGRLRPARRWWWVLGRNRAMS
jgi:hypothetical protein